MGVLIGILFSIEAIISVLLIGIILLQKSKDEGLGLAFGAGVGETDFGGRALLRDDERDAENHLQ